MNRKQYNELKTKIEKLEKELNGGKGSGNFGHAGRPGKIGGSSPESGGQAESKASKTYTKADQIDSLYKVGQITKAERDELIAKAEADGTAKDKVEKPKKETKKATHDLSHTSDSAKKDYQKEFPQDELGGELNDFSYDDVLEALSSGKDVYDVFGTGDSVVREHVFQMLEKKTGIPYDEIYDAWTDNPRKLNERLAQSPRAYELQQKERKAFDDWRETGDVETLKKAVPQKESDEGKLRSMVSSVWAYDGDKESNKYLHDPNNYTSLSAKERKKIIDDEWKYLDEHCAHPFAGTDGEGVSYNTTIYAPSKTKK